MSKRAMNYEESLNTALKDPDEAAAYLSAAVAEMAEAGPEVFLLALLDVAKANGISDLAEKADLSRTSLYKALSNSGAPLFTTVFKVLTSLNLEMDIHRKVASGEK